MATEIQSELYYTSERLISECQKAIDKYGRSVKLVYVYWDSEHSIGHKYRVSKDQLPAWTRLETGGAWAYIESDCEALKLRVLELLRWFIYSNPNTVANLAECATQLAARSSIATQPPLQTREGKQSFVCTEDGKPFVFFDLGNIRDIIDNDGLVLFKRAIKNTAGDYAFNHFKEYPDCQWTMVWDDILGAIQMAASEYCLPSEIKGIVSQVNRKVGETIKNVSQQLKTTGVDDDSTEIEPTKPVAKSMGWTQSELCEYAEISNSTFRAIRKNAEVEPSAAGGEGQQRRYTPAELGKLIIGVLLEKEQGGNFRNKVEISKKWEALEENVKHLKHD